MQEQIQPNYYAVIPADVRYAKIKANAKLLYGEISALANKEGYCWASNKYFAELYDVSETAISLWIKELADNGFIQMELIKDKNGTARKLYLKGALTKVKGGALTKVKTNNTSTNITSNNISTNVLIGETPKKTNTDVDLAFNYWREIVGYSITSKVQANRRACYNLVRKYKPDGLKRLIGAVNATQSDKYAPTISDFVQLQSKQNELIAWAKKQGNSNKIGVVV